MNPSRKKSGGTRVGQSAGAKQSAAKATPRAIGRKGASTAGAAGADAAHASAEAAASTAGGGARASGPGAKVKAEAPKWTGERREIFFGALAECCNVAQAARDAGFESSRPVYLMKARDAEFAARFEAAVAEGYSRLELEMLERSRFGENRPSSAGQSPERLREIPTGLAMSLLKFHQSKVRASAPTARRPMRGAKLRDQLEARLSEINRRLGGKG